jgi:hypothetical protein
LRRSTTLHTTTVAQLADGTWLENIAVRANGALLVASLNDDPGLYTIQDPSAPKPKFELLVPAQDLGGANIALGIAEIETDDGIETFALIVGRQNGLAQFEVGSYSIWTVKFYDTKCGESFKVEKVTDGTDTSALLNGLSAIPGLPNVALVADSGGLIARVDLATGSFDDRSFTFPETMAPVPNSTFGIGVNGVHVRGEHVYWTNSDLVTIYRLLITKDGYPKKGAEPEVVINLSRFSALIDDFIFDKEGNIYVPAFDVHSVIWVNVKAGTARVVAGSPDTLTLPGVTAVAFGRGDNDKDTLYATTSGGLAGPVNGETEGAKVVAIDTESLSC